MLLLGKQKNGGNFDILLLSSFLLILEKKKKNCGHGGKTLSSPFFFPSFFPYQIRENDISSYPFPLLFFMLPKISAIKESSNATNPYHSY